MATNYTEHYQLNQWEPTDKVLRTDFNADNLKIDTALNTLAEGLGGKVELAELEARLAALPKIITGSFQGTGTQETIHYPIGARPKCLILLTYNQSNVGFSMLLVIEGHYLRLQKQGANQVMNDGYVVFTDNGFTIKHGHYSLDSGFNQGSTNYCAFC